MPSTMIPGLCPQEAYGIVGDKSWTTRVKYGEYYGKSIWATEGMMMNSQPSQPKKELIT